MGCARSGILLLLMVLCIQPGAVKLVLWRHWMHVTHDQVHLVTSASDHAWEPISLRTRLYSWRVWFTFLCLYLGQEHDTQCIYTMHLTCNLFSPKLCITLFALFLRPSLGSKTSPCRGGWRMSIGEFDSESSSKRQWIANESRSINDDKVEKVDLELRLKRTWWAVPSTMAPLSRLSCCSDFVEV